MSATQEANLNVGEESRSPARRKRWPLNPLSRSLPVIITSEDADRIPHRRFRYDACAGGDQKLARDQVRDTDEQAADDEHAAEHVEALVC